MSHQEKELTDTVSKAEISLLDSQERVLKVTPNFVESMKMSCIEPDQFHQLSIVRYRLEAGLQEFWWRNVSLAIQDPLVEDARE